ncbi:hypothetical protein QR98_0052040 [Sarcoptes scabiei]|uniref:RING-type E3 ubiquitin transferase n=1 Tax=Sarcoptes scabiei TaxID=52283 RepID=A0A132A6X2_SARSC|nr:hypothetical protein QR98_0052040 [Sarcoptes scabiei]
MDSVGSFCCPFAIQRKIQILSQYSLSYDMPLTERLHVIRIAISIAYRAAIEIFDLIQRSNLWVSLRKKGCQYLGPAIQEEILKLIILALGDDAQLTRKVLTLYILQKIDKKYCSKATKTSVGHVVQILYRSNCFKLIKRKNDSCLMQLKKEFENYEDLRRKHDKEIIEIAIEDGIRLSPGQWSSLLYGDTKHKSQMQSILDKVNAKDSFELLALSLEDIDAKYFEHLDPQERRQFQLFQNLIPLISINDEGLKINFDY